MKINPAKEKIVNSQRAVINTPVAENILPKTEIQSAKDNIEKQKPAEKPAGTAKLNIRQAREETY